MHNKIYSLVNKKRYMYIQHLFNAKALNFNVKKNNLKFFVYTLNMGLDETFFFGNLIDKNSNGNLVIYNDKDLSTLIINIYCPSIYVIALI